MVTAEAAAAIPALLLVLGLAAGLVAFACDEVRCVDAARAGARAAARGDSGGSAASALAPGGSAVTVVREADVVVVRVVGGRAASWLPGGLRPTAEARMPVEQTS